MIEEIGGQALAVRCDVTQTRGDKGCVGSSGRNVGRVDAALNNAGVEQPITATADLTEEEWHRIIAINLDGVFACTKHEIPLMLNQGGGAIVNTSSKASQAKPRTRRPNTA
jgi:NAD(P)-dependent dehydrogenase (short-subunit alcohol dehydrogenase family)